MTSRLLALLLFGSTIFVLVCEAPGTEGDQPMAQGPRNKKLLGKKTKTSHPCEPNLLSPSKPKAPETFRFRPHEAYQNAPVVHYEVDESGKVTKVRLLRSSGVRDIDSWVLNEVKSRKYGPPPCGVVESEESVTIDFYDTAPRRD